jgi:hypothetical protein
MRSRGLLARFTYGDFWSQWRQPCLYSPSKAVISRTLLSPDPCAWLRSPDLSQALAGGWVGGRAGVARSAYLRGLRATLRRARTHTSTHPPPTHPLRCLASRLGALQTFPTAPPARVHGSQVAIAGRVMTLVPRLATVPLDFWADHLANGATCATVF